MHKAINWLDLWGELSERQEKAWEISREKENGDDWHNRALDFDAGVRRRWARPDSSREFVSGLLRSNPDWTAIDIGGGTGAWTALMAQHARHVTVVEPSRAMIEVMSENLVSAEIHNVDIVPEKWPDPKLDKHDLAFCSHAMYGFVDFEMFIRSVEAVTRRMCIMLMRAPTPDDLLSIASVHIWGHPYDSPDFQVAYNALLQMGIFANVLMEDSGLWEPWTHPTIEEALTEAKRKLGLPETSKYDEFLKDLLKRNLTLQDGRYVWPRGIRSALVYWHVE